MTIKRIFVVLGVVVVALVGVWSPAQAAGNGGDDAVGSKWWCEMDGGTYGEFLGGYYCDYPGDDDIICFDFGGCYIGTVFIRVDPPTPVRPQIGGLQPTSSIVSRPNVAAVAPKSGTLFSP